MKLTLRVAVVFALLLSVYGCGDSGSSTSTGSGAAEVPTAGSGVDLGDPGPPPAGQSEPSESTPSSDSSATAAPSGTVALQVDDWAGVEKLIAAHAGKVVVVDLWSTSCIPCRREFPNLVQLHRDLGPAVACISVSTDYDGIPSKPPETYREKVLAFLTEQHATIENVLSSTAAEDLFNELKIGSIPAVFVYDQSGKRAKVFADPVDGEEFTYADHIRPFVQGLLSTP
jgi:thiol-disulfide isomerase/thioredoxin